MLKEGRKRDAVANTLLGLSFAASAAQSPKDFVRTGNIEGPGIQLMARMMKNRAKANANLDSPRVSEPARNRKLKTFREFLEEAKISSRQPIFTSRTELEKHHGGIPSGYYANNAGSTERPKWRLKSKSGGVGERTRRKERIEDLSSSGDQNAASNKVRKLQLKGLEVHHITPIHHSAKLKSSMSDAEWEQRTRRDAAIGVYHGHHPKNIMGTKKSTDPVDKPGFYHRKGGAHEIEAKTKDIVSGPGSRESAISHKELLAAAARRQKKAEQNK